jgi:hypothetical protein
VAGVPAVNHRYVPDIALNASAHHDGYLVCSGGNCVNGFVASDNTLTLVGGTSVGAPVFAGILGLINQAAESNGQGWVNPTLYSLYASHPSAFHDVTSGDNKVPCTAGKPNCPSGTTSIGYSAAAGYDLATGLGSLDAFNLVSAWPGFNATSSFSLSSNPANVSIASAGSSGSSSLTISSVGGFTGTVALTCSVIPLNTNATCSLNPTSVALNNTTSSATATLTVATIAAHNTSAAAGPHGFGWLASGSTLLAGIFAIGFPARRRRRAVALGVFVLCGILLLGIGCGGGSSSSSTTSVTSTTPGTAAGTFTVSVQATSGSVSHSTNITVTLQ